MSSPIRIKILNLQKDSRRTRKSHYTYPTWQVAICGAYVGDACVRKAVDEVTCKNCQRIIAEEELSLSTAETVDLRKAADGNTQGQVFVTLALSSNSVSELLAWEGMLKDAVEDCPETLRAMAAVMGIAKHDGRISEMFGTSVESSISVWDVDINWNEEAE